MIWLERQKKVPLYDACRAFVDRKQVPFYCPGHKGGRTLDPTFRSLIAALDLNNLADTDTLHCPRGPIFEAEELLAEAYGVAKSFILVGGSSAGNMASIMSCVLPGKKIFVQRNAHKSIVAGLIHAGAEPVWINPVWDEEFEIAHGVALSSLQQAVEREPACCGVALLNPTYYGTTADFAALAALCKAKELPLLADEAHGPHFHFHPALPLAAEDAGADLIVQSCHKILSTLSQGAVLHLNGRFEEQQVRKILQLIQTTSPNFAIMASIDLARREMALSGRALWEKTLQLAAYARERILALPGVRLLSAPPFPSAGSGFFAHDPSKLLIDVKAWSMTGYQLLALLNKEFGIQPELAGPWHVLCIMSHGNEQQDVDALVNALQTIASKKEVTRAHPSSTAVCPFFNNYEVAMLPREAFYAPSSSIPLAKALDRISAEVVTPYPPGIPLLMPGERISSEILEILRTIKQMGNPISASDPTLSTLRVVQ